MAKRSFPIPSEARTRTRLEAEFARAVTTPGLSPLGGREWEALFPRFARHYQQLARLPRRTRRAVQRQWKQSLAGLALLLALGQAPALAATINVTGTCTLADAITAANDDTATGGCRKGRGADTLRLQPNSVHTLTSEPLTVRSKITIEGRGSTIQRSSTSPAFRIFSNPFEYSDLTLKETTVSGGTTVAGGGIYNAYGTLTLIDSTVSGNSAGDGGGIYNRYGTVTLTRSTVSGNSAIYGGGIYHGYGTLTLNRTLVSGNTGSIGQEVSNFLGVNHLGVITANNDNLFGHSGLSDANAFYGFAPGINDINANATPDGTNTPLGNILNTTLANNGGLTKTHALVSGSPAIDAVGAGCPPPNTDQRGVHRPQGLACDIGAFEFR